MVVPGEKLTSYTIAVKTGDKFAAGTDASVFIQLIGSKQNSEPFCLKDSLNHWRKFKRNNTDVFYLHQRPVVGDIQEVSVWHNNRGPWPGWHLEKVNVHDSATNYMHYFYCNRWLARDEEDGMIQRRLRCQKKKLKTPTAVSYCKEY